MSRWWHFLAALVTVRLGVYRLDPTDRCWFKQKGAEGGNHHPHWFAVYLSSPDPKSLHFWDQLNASCHSTKNWIINVTSVLWILIKGFSALALLVLRAREFFVERRDDLPVECVAITLARPARAFSPYHFPPSWQPISSLRHCWMSPETYDCLSSSHGW